MGPAYWFVSDLASLNLVLCAMGYNNNNDPLKLQNVKILKMHKDGVFL